MHAHNCYPDHGRWADRIDRALSAGTPLIIEQDLFWAPDGNGGGRSVVAHNAPLTGEEPSLREHFFDRVQPIIERGLTAMDRSQWPLLVLHLDFKTEEPEHLAALWDLLGEHEDWLTTAERVADGSIQPFDLKPLWVITEDSAAKEKAFHDDVPVGARLRVFGSAPRWAAPEGTSPQEQARLLATTSPEELLPGKPNNYVRWWNNSWHAVERGGQPKGGQWTVEEAGRLRALVDHAHERGFWIRFYCLDGHDPADESMGWSKGYSFGSQEAVEIRWRAAVEAGVDFLATDQYEDLARLIAELR